MTLPYGAERRDDDPGEPGAGTPRVSVAADDAELLQVLATGTCLEIGTGLGRSTRALAQVCSLVHTVDVDPWVEATIRPALERECPNVRSVRTLAELLPWRQYDTVFIDGAHDALSVAYDIERTWPLLRPGGLMLFHDTRAGNVLEGLQIGFHPARFAQRGVEVASNYARMIFFPTAFGLGMLRKEAK